MGNINILISILGIISSLVFLINLIFLNFFYFYPFQIIKVTVKLNSSNDIFLLLIKFVFILRLIFIKNEYISLLILLLLFLFLELKETKNPVYNINKLEILLNIRNSVIIWTYLILLVEKLCKETKINGLIYLLVIGYPIIIFCSIIIFKEYETEFNYHNSSFNNITSCINKTRFLINLINSFIDDSNRHNLNYYEYINKKNDILLKGLINLHVQTCIRDDCPLTKFINNEGNYNVQK